MAKVAVILPAAGRSSRFGGPKKKVFCELDGRPIWLRSLDPFLQHPEVVQRILVLSPDDLDSFREHYAGHLAFLDLELVPGGAERADSVQAGLARVRQDVELVAVHDAARPLVTEQAITAVFASATKTGAAILAEPITSTLKRVVAGSEASAEGPVIEATVSRERLWAAQTPQVFRRDWLLEAYARREGFVATDEAQLVERAGYAVHLVPGSPTNIKVTSQEDLKTATLFWKQRQQRSSRDRLSALMDDDDE
jgi:2-C-methyl-D-erythritol 4-phosphate cytidylyltransferase